MTIVHGSHTAFPTVAQPISDTSGVASPLVGAMPEQNSRGRHRAEQMVVLAAAFAAYFTVAMLLDFKYHSFDPDSISRMANGFYVVHSRDPHLAAVGFVWNPLWSFAAIPLLLFNGLWPVLASHNVAGTFISSAAMAGAVYQLHAVLSEWRVRRAPRLILTALFALNPMILFFGGNGMSEAGYVFGLLATTRYLLRWMRQGDLTSLVYAAIALGVTYLDRNETVAAAALAGPLVLWITVARTPGNRRSKIWAGLTDITILLIPIVTTVMGWAVISFVITGEAFGQFSSKYGNSAQISEAHFQSGHYGTRIHHEIADLAHIGILLPMIILLAVVCASIRRNNQILGVFAVLGGALAFTLVGYLGNSIFPWFRFYISAIPIQVLLVGSLFAQVRTPKFESPIEQREIALSNPSDRPRATLGAVYRAAASLLAVAVALLLLVPSSVGTAMGMMNPNIGPDELQDIGFIFHSHLNSEDQGWKASYGTAVTISHYIDSLHLPNGDVVADTADSCMPNVITNVNNPRVFVITNDRDFQRVLADPLTFHAHYLIAQAAGVTSADAVSQAYPNLVSGTSWAHLMHTFPSKGYCVGLRLYKVTGHPTEGG